LEEVQGAPPPRPAPTPTPAPSKPASNRPPPPATPEEEMRQSIINFFNSARPNSYVDLTLAYGLAKDIVHRLEQEQKVFKSVQMEIDMLKKPPNYSYELAQAYNLEYGLALVKGLGLTEATHDRNQMFLLLGMPAIPLKKSEGE
ncbi:MAG TPA: hypothetical protein VFU32_05560, partial [Ktedonobacterales bacterium]|nr:hypothetical protein [Ktedonobacterales bacterium]